MGMAYGNNLVYIVCFYLTTMGLALAKMTNDHVDKVFIEKVYINEAYAEADQILYVVIRNTSKQTLKQVELRIAKEKAKVTTDLKPEETQVIEVLWTPKNRGLQKPPRIRLQSSYPAALFEAWKILKSEEEIVVYPTRRGSKDFPQSGSASAEAVGVLKEIRDYQGGDSPKRIHWRSLAKIGQLRTLIHEGNESPVCYISWNQLNHLDLESKVEQLTLWISMAESRGSPWNLKLPHAEFDSQNANAVRLALTELATRTAA